MTAFTLLFATTVALIFALFLLRVFWPDSYRKHVLHGGDLGSSRKKPPTVALVSIILFLVAGFFAQTNQELVKSNLARFIAALFCIFTATALWLRPSEIVGYVSPNREKLLNLQEPSIGKLKLLGRVLGSLFLFAGLQVIYRALR